MAVPVLETEAITDITASVTTIEVTKPASLADNDVVVIAMALDGDAGDANMDGETGWTRIVAVSEGAVELFVWYKRITDAAGEPSTWTIDWTGTEQGRVQSIRVSGCITSGDPTELGATNTGNSVTSTALSFNTSNDDQLAISIHVKDRDRIDSGDVIAGTGWTIEIGTPGSSGGSQGAGMLNAEKDIATAGATEDSTVTTAASDQWATVQVSLLSISPVAPTTVVPLVINAPLTM